MRRSNWYQKHEYRRIERRKHDFFIKKPCLLDTARSMVFTLTIANVSLNAKNPRVHHHPWQKEQRETVWFRPTIMHVMTSKNESNIPSKMARPNIVSLEEIHTHIMSACTCLHLCNVHMKKRLLTEPSSWSVARNYTSEWMYGFIFH